LCQPSTPLLALLLLLHAAHGLLADALQAAGPSSAVHLQYALPLLL
jgi:hypothetical protein